MLKKLAATGLVALAAAGTLLTAAPAFADDGDGPTTSGNDSILGGNQIDVPINIPISVCGNSVIPILSISGAGCHGDVTAVNKDHTHTHVHITKIVKVHGDRD